MIIIPHKEGPQGEIQRELISRLEAKGWFNAGTNKIVFQDGTEYTVTVLHDYVHEYRMEP